MVCTANDLSAWKDFPKGLRVLLLDEDSTSAAEIKSKLEAMDYIVFTFCNEKEALSAISSKQESFHVAIVEVSTSNSDGSFKFLEAAKDLPTIMTSNIHCLGTMMKCIALGAVEFLGKPLSDDKLKNIWQHVVHKAFNAKGSVISESLKPVKQPVVSMMQLQLENGEANEDRSEKTVDVSLENENELEQSAESFKYPAPLTPQLKQGGRFVDDEDCQDQTNSLMRKENGEQDGEIKSVETTCGNSVVEETLIVSEPQSSGEIVIKEETDLADGANNEGNLCPDLQNKDNLDISNGGTESSSKATHSVSGIKASRKKMKVDWTPELHRKFVEAVEQLGIDQAIPSRILELMKVEGLTRHNVASHLQKYRIQRKHILPKDDDRRWPHQKDQMQRNYRFYKPIMAFPTYHSNPALPAGPVFHVWGAPNTHPAPVPMWGGYPPWPPTDSWQWEAYPGLHADAWGCPVMPPTHTHSPSLPHQNTSGFYNAGAVNGYGMPQNSFEHHPAEEIVDEAVKEAISKPWLPLPLGLKPPSTECVLAELSRQGISSIPPNINSSNSC
ncbi:two-component response regulator-like APRR2 [Tripterygium wilfordii]|uniref:Two-component response regulator-like APRR2 n=1 Tax=Tripterygium wilfordii TaxID=458696 RepID=A0A7J7CJN3_TRIWF|nr:two-component response regulator-like APRR2 [Tripterygium wilfordii]XP_038680455.1 two-component response regulator-like APRR2 [Tripterygium wilfordii]XP_038680456.1 two-component response regulator-like APRR2 [Tripterygium wilfordii]KAF5734270.1 two-component response regulator-like APRR2 [Tripterygium wilfordii]